MTVVDRLRSHVVVAVVRAPSAQSAIDGVEALVRGGVTGIEITYSTPDAPKVIAAARERHADDVTIGAGTVVDEQQAWEAVDAGAEFLVSPGTVTPVAEAMRATGVPFAVGALTPTEVMQAVALGADIVKLFPGSLGGPEHLKALRGPFPDVPLMPTGGVSIQNARAWLDAGAICLGVGGDLVPADLLAAGDYAEIERRARAFRAAVS